MPAPLSGRGASSRSILHQRTDRILQDLQPADMGASTAHSTGYGSGLLQTILHELLCHGIPPQRHVVSYIRLYMSCVHVYLRISFSTLLCSLCCAYLAFKVDEYNLTLDQFVHVLAPHLIKPTADFILSHEVSNRHHFCYILILMFSLSLSVASFTEAQVSFDYSFSFSSSNWLCFRHQSELHDHTHFSHMITFLPSFIRPVLRAFPTRSNSAKKLTSSLSKVCHRMSPFSTLLHKYVCH